MWVEVGFATLVKECREIKTICAFSFLPYNQITLGTVDFGDFAQRLLYCKPKSPH